jgi:hypothetical protein
MALQRSVQKGNEGFSARVKTSRLQMGHRGFAIGAHSA